MKRFCVCLLTAVPRFSQNGGKASETNGDFPAGRKQSSFTLPEPFLNGG